MFSVYLLRQPLGFGVCRFQFLHMQMFFTFSFPLVQKIPEECELSCVRTVLSLPYTI